MKKRDLSDGECIRIAEAMHTRHDAYLEEDEHFRVSGYVSDDLVYTKMILRNEDDSFYYPVECRIEPNEANISPDDALYLILDFQDYYFGRYFREDRDLYLTVEWGFVDFDDTKIQAKGQIFNRQLEDIADDLLAGKKLQ